MNLASQDKSKGRNAEETVVRPKESGPPGTSGGWRLLSQRAYLIVTAGEENGARFYLSRKTHLIGRSSEVEITLADDSISRTHARISYRNDEFVLADLDSKNGTFLNGTRVHECPLHYGDEITVGNHVLRFMYEAVVTS